MSVEFRVKNKKRPLFLGYFGVMSVGKAAELIPDLAVFGIDENAENFDKEGQLMHDGVRYFVLIGVPKHGKIFRIFMVR
ncbi:MAG: hypothetical protein ACFNYB_08255, partial [Campylobacter sp.]